ncbi:murein L,D-transpeptidase family protein [Mesorhizobium sp. BAC0120]|uniref:murein L,D-transpeptidase family protein n=1 Tax=Mesorhizobium sp. BAC0120 TaxID=3090670 RepID=UPI00298CDED0|nr:murein L,D-transpeptidase family protein [Mesorhizobium sp. BAC0120]MDW6026071.1 murein L,D-transpeptidase family protein [Mesorhizobium sp. BAC0120]
MLAKLARATLLSVTVAASAALIGCNESSIKDFVPAKATKELPPAILTKMSSMGMQRNAPIVARIFKEEGKLEIWKQKTNGRYAMIADYNICKWSGQLGPKYIEGDRQAPEGFYTVRPGQMNPNSNYYLAFNIGYPNAYDRANGRTGSNLMVHGACSSSGCYSMTDEQIGQIYAFGRDAFQGGQTEFQIQAFPFRMTAENMARYRNDPNYKFWQMLKEGYDQFEITKVPPKVDVCEKRYVFNRIPENPNAIFSPTGACPSSTTSPELQTAYQSYQSTYQAAFDKALKKSNPLPPRPTILGLEEAKLVADWTHRRARGERITIEPPDLQADGTVKVTDRMGRIDSEVGRKMAAKEATDAEKKRIAEEKALALAAEKAAKIAEKAAKERAAAVAAAAPEQQPPQADAPVAATAAAQTEEVTTSGAPSFFGAVRKRISNIF